MKRERKLTMPYRDGTSWRIEALGAVVYLEVSSGALLIDVVADGDRYTKVPKRARCFQYKVSARVVVR